MPKYDEFKVGSRVVITCHDTWQHQVGIIYHIEDGVMMPNVSVALDYGYGAIELPIDSVQLDDSKPVYNPAIEHYESLQYEIQLSKSEYSPSFTIDSYESLPELFERCKTGLDVKFLLDACDTAGFGLNKDRLDNIAGMARGATDRLSKPAD